MSVRTKRVYEPASPRDGRRVLIDRLWPRGMSKARAHIDVWLKDAAPSAALRKWYGHEPEKWPEFRRRYLAELRARPDALKQLRAWARGGTLTLLFAARDAQRCNAAVLKALLSRAGTR